jgi:hypothetical protein
MKKHSTKRKTPPNDIIKGDYEKGLSIVDMGKMYGVSPQAVHYALKRIGVSTRAEKQIGLCGKSHPQWKGGRGIKSGYWTVYIEKHPRKLNNGRVYEHILVAEKKYGRFIKKGEPIHHIDFDRLNNKPENLYLCKNHKEHMDLHYSLEEVARDLFRNGKLKFEKGQYIWNK